MVLSALEAESFLHLADFLFDFAADRFALAFGYQLGIVDYPADLFLNFAFQFVKLPRGTVPNTLLHGFSLSFWNTLPAARGHELSDAGAFSNATMSILV